MLLFQLIANNYPPNLVQNAQPQDKQSAWRIRNPERAERLDRLISIHLNSDAKDKISGKTGREEFKDIFHHEPTGTSADTDEIFHRLREIRTKLAAPETSAGEKKELSAERTAIRTFLKNSGISRSEQNIVVPDSESSEDFSSRNPATDKGMTGVANQNLINKTVNDTQDLATDSDKKLSEMKDRLKVIPRRNT